MKQLFILLCISCASWCMATNNLQMHYDFGKDRQYVTSTIEHFSTDKYGSTFFFADFTYQGDAPVEGYWEIARELKFWEKPFSVHVEYNGGLNTFARINNAYLLGGTYTWDNADFTKGFSLSGMYKYIQGNPSPHNFQLTGVWYMHFWKNRISFTGFADFWRERQDYIGTSFIFMTEPQLWYNINKSFSVGSEVELAYNFAAVKGFKACPTLAVKWTF